MKANWSNLVKVMKISAQAHNAISFENDEDNEMIIIKTDKPNLSLYSDISDIVKAFFVKENSKDCVGYFPKSVSFCKWDNMRYQNEVDLSILELALPKDSLKKFI